jgi:peptide/nickel transport system substrate-binding protein
MNPKPRAIRACQSSAAVTAVLVIAALLFGACGSGSSTTPTGDAPAATAAAGETTEGAIVEGGIFRVGYTDIPDGISPFVGSNQMSYVIFQEMYPALVQYDENFQIVGDWAESWTVSDDSRTYTFSLRPGEWSDGTPLTAADAVWTFETVLAYADGATGLMAGYIDGVESVRAIDDLTLEVVYAEPKATALANLQPFYILPRHFYEPNLGKDGKGLTEWDMAGEGELVGGGPFFVKQYDDKGTTILERNPGYYGPKPHVDTIGMTVYQNADAMVSAFKAGDLDAIDKVPYTLVDQLAADPNIQIVPGDVPDIINVGFNANPKKPENRELLDPQVKEAMDLAIDRQTIIDTIFSGYAVPAASILTPIAGDYLNPEIGPIPFDPDEANRILDEAGYARGDDGIRVTPDGEPMRYEVILPTDLEGQDRKFSIIQTNWRDIGIEVTGNPMDAAAAWDAMIAPDGKYLDFDMHMWSWLGYVDPDFMLMTVMCDQYENWSDTGYCNPEYDALYAQQAAEMDPEKRRAIIWEMQEVLLRDRPYIFIAQGQFVRAYKKDWGGIKDPYLLYVSKIPWDSLHRTAE